MLEYLIYLIIHFVLQCVNVALSFSVCVSLTARLFIRRHQIMSIHLTMCDDSSLGTTYMLDFQTFSTIYDTKEKSEPIFLLKTTHIIGYG